MQTPKGGWDPLSFRLRQEEVIMSYTLSTDTKFVSPRTVERYNWNAAVGWYPIAGGSNTAYTTTWNKTRTGQKVLDYQAKIRAGSNAGSPYTLSAYQVEESQPSRGTLVLTDVWNGPPTNIWFPYTMWRFRGIWRSPDPNTVSHLGVSQSKAEAAALTKTYSKIRSEYQRLNASASVAEFGDVIRQFGKPFDAIVDLTNRRLNRLFLEKRGLKGSTAFKRLRFAEIVASSYLEYAFGLSPLISDARKVAEALARFNTEEAEQYRYRSRISSRGEDVSKTNETVINWTGILGQIAFNSVTKKETQCGVQYICGLKTDHIAAYGSNERLLQVLGFTPQDWLPAAWEVVPWSWLLDYFTNVGDIISAAATSVHGVTWINKTVRTKTVLFQSDSVNTNATVKALPYGVRLVSVANPDMGSHTCVRTSLVRSQPASLGVPPLVFEHPFGNVPKMLNMAAVLLARKPSASALWLT